MFFAQSNGAKFIMTVIILSARPVEKSNRTEFSSS